MASPALTASTNLISAPFLVRKLTVTSGTTAGTVLHGGPAVIPDIVIAQNLTTNPTAGVVAVSAKSTTTLTLDFEDNGNETWEFFCFWFNAAAGGIA